MVPCVYLVLIVVSSLRNCRPLPNVQFFRKYHLSMCACYWWILSRLNTNHQNYLCTKFIAPCSMEPTKWYSNSKVNYNRNPSIECEQGYFLDMVCPFILLCLCCSSRYSWIRNSAKESNGSFETSPL
jgi:hypothetical protein